MGDRNTHAEFDDQYFSEFYSNLCEPLAPVEIEASTPLFNEIQSLKLSSKCLSKKEAIAD